MNKADKYFLDTLEEITKKGTWDKNPRPKWKDGSEAHSLFITQKFFKYDIAKGEFPIITLRPTALKSSLGEILTIYRDQSNKEIDFKRNGVYWWSDWMNKDGNLGTAYAWNLEPYDKSREVVKIKRKNKKVTKIQGFGDFVNVYSKKEHKLANTEVIGKYCNFRVLDKTSNKPLKFKVQLLDTGEIREVGQSQVRYKNIKSRYYKSINGTGFYGNYKRFDWLGEDTIEEMKKKWSQMFERCFSKNKKLSNWNPNMIDERWNSFENFLEDCLEIPQFFTAKRDSFKGWVLDKDYYGANFYSKSTCVFIQYKDNELYSEDNKVYFFEGEAFLSVKDLAERMNEPSPKIYFVIRKSNLSLNNQKIRDRITVVYNNDEEYLYRFEVNKNQVTSLLKNLEKDPFSRRHMTSFYNWKHQEGKQLVECAYQTMWTVRELGNAKYIDLTLIQRSMDYLTVASINPAQYVMLSMMVCNHLTFKTGVKHQLGDFLHFVQNVHIYNKHLDAAKYLLEEAQTVNEQPTLALNCEPKAFYNHTIEDFDFNIPKGIKKFPFKLEIAV